MMTDKQLLNTGGVTLVIGIISFLTWTGLILAKSYIKMNVTLPSDIALGVTVVALTITGVAFYKYGNQ